MPTKTDIGRAGEFLVMSRLSLLGLYCVHSDSYADDVWIKDKGGKIFTLQVKACREAKKRGIRSKASYYFRSYGSGADMYAFVALDTGAILYRTRSQVTTEGIRIRADKFTEQAEQDSLLFCLDKISNDTF